VQRRFAWIALVVVLAVVVGYFVGRAEVPASPMSSQVARIGGEPASSGKKVVAATRAATSQRAPSSTTTARTSRPLPPTGTPLKQIRDELQARAEAGDAEAAARLFRDTGRCAEVRRINSWAPRYARTLLNDAEEAKTPEQLKIRDQQLGTVQEKLDFAKNNASLCANLSDDEIDQLLPIALQAAQSGDVHAANCYVGGAGPGLPAGLIDHPEWLDEYRSNALSIADAAIARGDWVMVEQLALAYAGGPLSSSLLSQVTGENKGLAYRYRRLSRLGATAEANKDNLSYFDHQLSELASDITPEARAAADAWAQDAYRNFFGGAQTNRNYNRYIGYRMCDADDAGS